MKDSVVKQPTKPVKTKKSKKTLGNNRTTMYYNKSKNIDDLGLKIPEWRRILSNLYPIEIEVDGSIYPSVEHAFHAAKAKYSSKPEVSSYFEVGGRVSSDPTEVKKSSTQKAFAEFGAKVDLKRWKEQDNEMMKALRARLKADELSGKILIQLNSKGIQLVYYERTKKSYWGGNIRKRR